MARRNSSEVPWADMLLAVVADTPSLEDKVRYIQNLRAQSPDLGMQVDQLLIQQLSRQRQGLLQAQDQQKKLKAILDKLCATPWHQAVFVSVKMTDLGERALVIYGGNRRVVAVSDKVELSTLKPGDEVFLGNELNVLVAKSPWDVPRCGQTATFARYTSDRRIVLRHRDEEIVVDGDPLQHVDLRMGDRVRWDRTLWMAFEKIESADGRQFLLDEVPEIGRDRVGGQEENLENLLSTLTPIFAAPGKASQYGLGGRRSILLVGPPGCGKTLMVRVAVAELASLSGVRCRFGVVKPAEWESPWVGETQANIRNCFKAVREAAEDGFAVLFLDEIEAVGRVRGGAVGQHSDKFLAALLAELDGFAERGRVAIISATNRKDMVDPALLERLSEIEIEVKRPDLQGAQAIFGIHLPESLPYSPSGKDAAGTRSEIIAAAVSRFYSPNADNEIAVIRFRDGKSRVVAVRELASGRIFEQICRAACQAAFLRDVRGEGPGLQVRDINDAVSDAIQRLASTLSVRNAAAYLHDLPQDVDVVSVEPVVRRTMPAHRYLNVA